MKVKVNKAVNDDVSLSWKGFALCSWKTVAEGQGGKMKQGKIRAEMDRLIVALFSYTIDPPVSIQSAHWQREQIIFLQREMNKGALGVSRKVGGRFWHSRRKSSSKCSL